MRKEEIENVVEEIKEQDLDNQAAGGSWKTAIQLTINGRCGKIFTVSYECTTPHRRCA